MRQHLAYVPDDWSAPSTGQASPASPEAILAYIRGTTMETALRVQAIRIDQVYEKGIQVSAEVMQALNMQCAQVCPKWNYTIL
jgi:hypothetical protein